MPTHLGLTTHHTVAELTDDLTGWLNVSLRFIWDRIEAPVVKEDGTRPKQDDFQMIAALGVDFG